MIDITFDTEEGPKVLAKALDRICEEACKAAQDNYQFIVLSDRKAGASRYFLYFDLSNVWAQQLERVRITQSLAADDMTTLICYES